jgi:Flp pilus assembly protein TadG
MAQVRRSRKWAAEDGSQLVEFAVVLPLLLFVVLGIAEFGIIFQRYEVLTNAAREGARMAVLPGYTNADVEARVIAYAIAGGARDANGDGATDFDGDNVDVTDVTVPLAAGPGMPCKRVTVTYTHSYIFLGGITGLLFGTPYSTVPLSAVSEMRVEQP